MKLGTKALVLAMVASSTKTTTADDGYSFLVSQVSSSQDWCIVAPDDLSDWQNPSYDESALGFTHCEPYRDEYYEPRQSFRLESSGKIRSREYEDLCMIVHDGESIGGGLVRIDNCDIDSDLNKFVFNDGKIRLKNNHQKCLTNEGATPEADDTIHVKDCGDSGRYKFELQEARRHWQIIARDCGGVSACIMPKNGDLPQAGDRVKLDHCGSPQDAWRFDELDGSGAELFRYKLANGLCMHAGSGSGKPHDGAAVRFQPCDAGNDRQRFVREFDGDYVYRLTLEAWDDLCIVNHGSTCEIGDNMIVKDCSTVSGGDPERWYDDEA